MIVLAPLASADPDGLERVAEDHGFLQTARDALYSIIPDYTVPGVDGNLSTILAGLIGVAHRVRRDGPARARPRPPTKPGLAALDLDRYIQRESVLHRADARVKFVATVAFIVAVSLLPVGAYLALGLAWLVVVGLSVARSPRAASHRRAGRSSPRRSCSPRCPSCSPGRRTRSAASRSGRSR